LLQLNKDDAETYPLRSSGECPLAHEKARLLAFKLGMLTDRLGWDARAVTGDGTEAAAA
jgi:hypothetical protein